MCVQGVAVLGTRPDKGRLKRPLVMNNTYGHLPCPDTGHQVLPLETGLDEDHLVARLAPMGGRLGTA